MTLAKELWPGIRFSPTMTHSFLKLLSDKGLLLRLYTQNIDGLEFLAGIPEEKLVECHGHFRTAACIDCKKSTDGDRVKETIVIEGETPICQYCEGHVKPDIVFFGESLPDRFHHLLQKDLPKADLLMVMGTSLQVAPVSMIPNMVSCNKALFNRDKVMKIRKGRDIFVEGDCDESVQRLCDLLGWGGDLVQANEKSHIHNGSEVESEEPLDAEKGPEPEEEEPLDAERKPEPEEDEEAKDASPEKEEATEEDDRS